MKKLTAIVTVPIRMINQEGVSFPEILIFFLALFFIGFGLGYIFIAP